MSHPLHGARPVDRTAGFPAAARLLTADWERIAGSAITAAVERNPELPARLGEIGLRHLLRDGEVVQRTRDHSHVEGVEEVKA